MKLFCLFFAMLFSLVSCHVYVKDFSSIMELDNYKKLPVNADYYETRVLEVFPCRVNTKSQIKQANVYLCYFVKSKDTILLIDSKSRKVPSFFNEINIKTYLLLPINTNLCPEEVRVCLPQKYLTPSNIQCVCGTLKKLNN